MKHRHVKLLRLAKYVLSLSKQKGSTASINCCLKLRYNGDQGSTRGIKTILWLRQLQAHAGADHFLHTEERRRSSTDANRWRKIGLLPGACCSFTRIVRGYLTTYSPDERPGRSPAGKRN